MKPMIPKIAVVLAFGALAVAAMSAGPAVAARGGNGSDSQTSKATLAVDPATPTHGTPFRIYGCGYTVGRIVKVELVFSGGGAATGANVGTDGCISLYWGVDSAGSYTLNTYQDLKGNRWTLMATLPLTVQ